MVANEVMVASLVLQVANNYPDSFLYPSFPVGGPWHLPLVDDPVAGLRHRVDPVHVDAGQREVHDMELRLDVGALGRHGVGRHALLQDPAQHDLGSRSPVGLADVVEDAVLEHLAARQRAIGGQRDPRSSGGAQQLKILWEKLLARFPVIEVMGPPTRVKSAFVRGFTQLPVRIPS